MAVSDFPGWRIVIMILVMVTLSCGRKDVDRSGRIKMRGERPITVSGKKTGDLLQQGIASWYGVPYHGRRTANGEVYDMWSLTAAHKTLPFGTLVRVVNTGNRKSVVVRINDRGPFVRGRIIDLSRKAARAIDMEVMGTTSVSLYLQDASSPRRSPTRVDQAQLTSGYWTIQVGSFSERVRAERLAKNMRRFERRVRVEEANDFYRVRVGKFSRKSEAGKLAETLVEQEISVWIVFVAD